MLKVLLVDDDPSLLAGLRRALLGQPPQWEIRIAKEGREGLDLLAAEPADLVISDMRMPGMDGATFLTKVKEIYPETIRVVLSGYSDTNAALRSVQVAHQFLSKPCSPTALLRVIEQARFLYENLNPEMRLALASITCLPSSYEVQSKFERAINMNERIADIGAIAASDIALGAKLLQMVNSAFFGDFGTIVSVEDAAVRLGVNNLRDLMESTDFCRSVDSNKLGLSIEDLCQHASDVSVLATSLAPAEAAVAKTSAMLHDIGILALASEAPDKLAALHSGDTTSDGPLPSDAIVASCLLSIWGIPTAVIDAIRHYQEPPGEDEKMNAVNALRVAQSFKSDAHPGWTPPAVLSEGYLRSLGVDPALSDS